MKHIAILGSTGSIGQSTLRVVRNFPKKFHVTALSTNSNIAILYQQIKEFHPQVICVKDIKAALTLKSKIKKNKVKLYIGEEGLSQIISDKRIDGIVLAISGSAALSPLLKALDEKRNIALANKEALVMAGSFIMDKVRKQKVHIIPIDSEQSAIWQCLEGENIDKVKNIYLTASGGPLRNINKKALKNISIQKVLRHPRWKMGKKISVDSANLMNKGLEILEAMFLFGIELDKIKVIIHPQAIIHSMVEFIDGIILAQLSVTDMRIPIQYALSYPERLNTRLASIDFLQLKRLNFQRPNLEKFPCLRLAYRAARQQGTMPCVLNAANEISVDNFLKNRLDFVAIPKVIERVMDRHKNIRQPALSDILEVDSWARREAANIINRLN
jgi:1-deoxy-D-xylulose-5-phosphate reductoisomerase